MLILTYGFDGEAEARLRWCLPTLRLESLAESPSKHEGTSQNGQVHSSALFLFCLGVCSVVSGGVSCR